MKNIKKYEDFKSNEVKSFSKKSNLKRGEDKDIKNSNSTIFDYEAPQEVEQNILNDNDSAVLTKKLSPNQTNINTTKVMVDKDTESILPSGQITEKKKVKLKGKVASFPKDITAKKAYNTLENVKISKNKIWYILIEKQENELQMVKYETKKGVNLTNFINELKTYYISKQEDKMIVESLEKIQIVGDKAGLVSCIKNIPNIDIDGKKLIRKITEDLTTLLNGKCK